MSLIYHSWGMSGQPAAPPPHAFASSGMGVPPAKRYYTLAEWSRMHGGGLSGLGASGAQIVQSAGSIASSAVPATVAITHTAIFGWSVAATATVIGAVVAGVTLLLVAIFSRKGPKQKVATTQIVDKIEPLLKQNLAGYLAGPHTVSSQKQALANFDAGWQYVVEYCNTPEMGEPGRWCTNDRKAGACEWKDAQGQCFNWFSGYRDPIANDPNVKPDPVVDSLTGGLVDSLTGGVFGGTGGGTGFLLLAGAAVAAAMFLGGGKK